MIIFVLRFTPDQGFGSALSLAPFSSATDQYSDVTGRVSDFKQSILGYDNTKFVFF